MYICFFRMRLNQSTIRGSIRMSPSPSERQRFLTTSAVWGGGQNVHVSASEQSGLLKTGTARELYPRGHSIVVHVQV